MRLIVTLSLLLALGGCESGAQFRARMAAFDNQKCTDMDFKPGTEAFAKCRLQLDTNRPAMLDSMATAPSPVRQTRCTTVAGYTNCTTY